MRLIITSTPTKPSRYPRRCDTALLTHLLRLKVDELKHAGVLDEHGQFPKSS